MLGMALASGMPRAGEVPERRTGDGLALGVLAGVALGGADDGDGGGGLPVDLRDEGREGTIR